MEKIQEIEELFPSILNYSYAAVSLSYFFSSRKRFAIPILLALYGLIFFILLDNFEFFNTHIRKEYQTIYTFLEYTFFSYLIWIQVSTLLRRVISVLSIAFWCVQLTYLIFATTQKLDSVPVGIETILIFLYAFIYFYHHFKNNLDYPIYDHYSFWLVIGMILYLGGAFFFNILVNHVPKDQTNKIQNLTIVPEVVKNLLFVFALFSYKPIGDTKSNKKQSQVPNLDMI